jgi:hypothetical protein
VDPQPYKIERTKNATERRTSIQTLMSGQELWRPAIMRVPNTARNIPRRGPMLFLAIIATTAEGERIEFPKSKDKD